MIWIKTARQSKLYSYRHSRAKLKHVLWLGDLKATLINCTGKNIHKTLSTAGAINLKTYLMLTSSCFVKKGADQAIQINEKNGVKL